MSEIVRMVTVREVAEFLRLKEATVCRLASEGQLPGLKIGKSWRFDMGALERLVTGTQPDAAGGTVKGR
ncbi:MAG: helix-turn-helix domain-containing protein [Syntrophales bacterium]